MLKSDVDAHRLYKDSVIEEGRRLLDSSQPSDLDECHIAEQDFNRAIEDLTNDWTELEQSIADRQAKLTLSDIAQQVCSFLDLLRYEMQWITICNLYYIILLDYVLFVYNGNQYQYIYSKTFKTITFLNIFIITLMNVYIFIYI